ncbi:type II toxin-antitoxin system PemK/MazF family toxin [Desulfovibrio sp. OttesenSCG-928-G15]|nr:type II toxin-antitoxin system PemK/MazF family toxin [Desulfovibrio sp. OttesenSCG-928-G15]
MSIKYAPAKGSIIICEFDKYAMLPEMQKRRPVVVLSSVAPRLCLVVPLSTTEPEPQEPWHYLLNTPSPLPAPYDSKAHWVKGDMVFPASFDRLMLPFRGKDRNGKRIYDVKVAAPDDFEAIRRCVAAALFPGWLDNLHI